MSRERENLRHMPTAQAVPVPDNVFWAEDDLEADHYDRFGYERAPEFGPWAFFGLGDEPPSCCQVGCEKPSMVSSLVSFLGS